MRVVICGGGVIGACLAYFLARRGLKPIVVERAGVACAASGKSGGFLARDWCDGTPLERLARRSFALHASLAEELHDDWGYRRMTTYAGYGPAAGGHGAPPPAALGVGRRRLERPPRHARDDGAGRSRPLHARDDARRRGAWRRAAPRRRDRHRAPRRRRRGRRDGGGSDPHRRRRHRHGAVVAPCRANGCRSRPSTG